MLRYVFVLLSACGLCQLPIVCAEELENHISPEDLQIFLDMPDIIPISDIETRFAEDGSEQVDCFGLGSFMNQLPLIFDLKPGSSESVNTHFFFSSRSKPERQRVNPGEQFDLESVNFNANRKTVVIIHGFMSYSNSSWVHEMTRGFLNWADVNVIAVDWSAGGNTWKYWRAVANTRRVSADVSESCFLQAGSKRIFKKLGVKTKQNLMSQLAPYKTRARKKSETSFLHHLKNVTGASFKDFHFVGHSLGAHISSFVSFLVGGVARITGLDPAQPCFRTDDLNERLDNTDADFVDIIHTNGRLLQRIGFGLPEQIGHADFYPNGGMKQPGCRNETKSLWSKVIPFYDRLQQAICSHGRSYLLFTESLINNECAFKARRWNLTYEGLDWNLTTTCQRQGNCVEMGIKAEGGKGLRRANGPYFTWTTDKEPYCATDKEISPLLPHLLRDLLKGFRLDNTLETLSNSTRKSSADSIIKGSWFSKLISSLSILVTFYVRNALS